jgi:hypothetical protein
VKFFESPIASPNMRSERWPIEWKVPPQNRRGSTPVSSCTRWSISLADLLVKVRSRISPGRTPCERR